jgi:hypothetical protein
MTTGKRKRKRAPGGGRKPKPGGRMEQVMIRVEPGTRARIKERAAAEGKIESEWLRDAIVDALSK